MKINEWHRHIQKFNVTDAEVCVYSNMILWRKAIN
ncbi:hypothetical protein P9613_09345 [Bacillus atrophaeus]|nr:hypothetical protein [Bacillus atrophaeus]MEC1899577.1 hypothetical protein [Bacillus atrophaeus]MEC2395436.1 hypothetical protein [Bacillus atrophaeus]MED4435353.1 hypothetical protein [Bacillus atrophaeus]MED4566122.1 hypothetical protein [Bacillus atrophaeus]MED4574439.1 hypothetical protein [Bacillus atrophaeus]